MAKAVLVTLADEVTNDLNKKSGAWSQAFTAVRRYQPKLDMEGTDGLSVQVVPIAWRKEPNSRREWQHEYDIDIGVIYRAAATAGDQAAAKYDELLKLVEEISDYYEDTRPSVADCVLTSVTFGGGAGAAYSHESIETKNTFISVIRLTFTKYR